MIDHRQPDFSNTPVSPKRPYFGYAPVDYSADPYVTIVTPFYNTGMVFHETAKSVLKQSFQQWEWLIINDGSTDHDALEILKIYRQNDPRIRVVDNPTNHGLSAARNMGFRLARTSFVVQLDSDDLLETTATEKWIWFLETEPAFGFVKGYAVGFGAHEYLWTKGFHHREEFLQENVADPTSMIRRQIHNLVGGYKETIKQGLEDWEFWLRCANCGYWGATIPEYLNWYRRRLDHTDRWQELKSERRENFRETLRQSYPRLWNGNFPHPQRRYPMPWTEIPEELPFHNNLTKNCPRLLMLLPWLTMGGADKFNLDLLRQLTIRGWEVTLATTLTGDHSWLPEFARYTPDIFILNHFLPLADYPRFLRYLIRSRQIDTVLISGSYLGYELLPYLQAYYPDVTFLDYLHMEDENWKNGGYPRASLNHASQLDLTVVSSEHLKNWLVKRGRANEQIEICTTNIDTQDWNPNHFDRTALKQQLDIDEQTPVILYAGRLCQQKQPRLFAQTILGLAKLQHPFVCLVAGDGEDRPFLEQFVKSNNLTCLRLLGTVSNQRMRELMAISDIFFLPSQMEGISLAIYEAMAMGVVPVGADVGGQRELVTPECGILISRSEAEQNDYLQALKSLLEDRKRRIQMGFNARQRVVQNFQLEQMGKRMIQLIRCAQERARQDPHPAIPLDLAHEVATLAIEYTRLEQVADLLWRQKEELLAASHVQIPLRKQVIRYWARQVRNLIRPFYRWALRHGMTWVVSCRSFVYSRFAQWMHPNGSR